MGSVSAERDEIAALAAELASSYPLRRQDAMFFAVAGYLQKKSVTVTPAAVARKLEELIGSSEMLTGKDLSELTDIAFQMHGTSLVPWLSFLWKKSAFDKDIFTEETPSFFSDSSAFFKGDDDAVSVIRHAIEVKSPLVIVIHEFIEDGSDRIAGRLLEKEGIPALLSRKAQSDAEYIEAALQAHHLNGLAIFSNDVPEGSSQLFKASDKFGLQFGIVRGYDEDKPKAKEAFEEMRTHPPVQKIPSVTYKPRPLYGKDLADVAARHFNDNPEFLRILSSSKVNVATICTSRKLLNYMTEKEDWKGIRKCLSSASKLDITADMVKTRQVLSDSYDVDALNMDTSPRMIERMARKATERHQPFRIVGCGGSGTGKTSFAYWLSRELGMDLIVKSVSDIQKMYIGESEAAIRLMFQEAEEKDAILLLDECETYLGRRSDSSTSGGKSYNSVTNCFLSEIERFSGILIGTTNRRELIDEAFFRRFHKIVTFSFPSEEGMRMLFRRYFPDMAFDEASIDEICRRGFIGPGDFSIIKENMEYMDEDDITPEFILTELRRNAELRNPTDDSRPIGFQ